MIRFSRARAFSGRVAATVIALVGGGAVALVGPPESALVVLLVGAAVLVGLLTGSQRVRLIVAGAAYLVVFVEVYVGFVAPVYSYSGSQFTPSGILPLGIAIAVAALPLLWLPCSLERPSHVVLWLLFLFAYVPATLVPFLITGDLAAVGGLMTTVAFGMAIVSWVAHLPLGRVAHDGLPMATWLTLLLVADLAVNAYIIISFGFPASIPGLETVYDTRSSYVEAAVSAVGPAGYLITWAGNVLNPLLFAAGLARRQWWVVVASLAGTLLIYAVTGLKSVAFGPVLALGVYALIRYRRDQFGPALLLVAAVLVASTTAITVITGNPWGLGLVPQRLLSLPGVLTLDYYQFFATHPVYELRHSIFGFLGPAPYDLGPPHLIGLVFFNSRGVGANANLWADGIANFWIPGALAMSVAYGLVLRLLDLVADRRDLRIVGPALGLMGLTVSNTAALTSLLTGGLLLMILFIGLLPEADRPGRLHQPPVIVKAVAGRSSK